MSSRIKHALQFAALGIAFVAHLAHAGMTTPGQFAVSPSGGATYSIPIQVPPGTGGIEPKLALTYNSQAGNGLLGMGWSLSGLSAITRCPRTMAQDNVRGSVNYDNNDRYCLDGQRLIALSGQADGANGTEYRTELDGFAKIVSYGTAGNGPVWFKVWTKSGQVMEYGNTTDSRIEFSTTPTVKAWALNRLQDTKGNYFTVTYTEDNPNGTYFAKRIDYTGNSNSATAPTNAIVFEYDQTRTDITPLYDNGALVKNLLRLAHLKTYTGTALVKSYDLTYQASPATQQSRLTSLRECDGSGSEQGCLQPVSLSWTGTEVKNFNMWLQSAPQTGTGANGLPLDNCKPLLAADVNGDGKTDLICPYAFGDGSTITQVQLSQGATFSQWQPWSQKTGTGAYGLPLENCKPLTVADVNGDGKPDLVCVYAFGDGSTVTQVQLNQGSSFAQWQQWSPKTGTGAYGLPLDNCKPLLAADVNGDGKTDLICPYAFGDGSTVTQVQLSQGTSFSQWQSWSTPTGPNGLPLANCKPLTIADVNGDGKPDLVCPYAFGDGSTATYVQLNQGSSFLQWQQWSPKTGTGAYGLPLDNCKPLLAADVNGDGKTDLICPYAFGDGSTVTQVQLSQGTSFSQWQSWSTPTGPNGLPLANCKPLTIADVNGDGKPDLVCAYAFGDGSTATYVQLNQGSSFLQWQQWGPQTSVNGLPLNNCKPLMAIDINGDGLADLACVYDYDNGVTTTFVQRMQGTVPDLLSTITPGDGKQTSIVYKPITDSSTYTKDATATYPLLDLQYALYVVSSVTSPNGVGGVLTTTYNYGGLKAEAGSGRGLLGFRWMQSTQQDSGITAYTEFRQDYPYTGLPSLTKKTIAGGGNNGVLNQVSTQYDCLDPATGGTCAIGPGHRYFPYAKLGTESSWDLDGSALPTIVTAGQYDIWGNATQISVTTSDGYGKTTVNTYAPADTDKWYLGRLTKATVTSTAP